jgi:prephenate dehydrogenase
MKIGIIGQGSFGMFAANILPGAGQEVITIDKNDNLDTVVKADAIILAIPLSAYDTVLPQLATLLQPRTLVIDICSVKMEAVKRLRHHLPRHPNLLISHPMFGPQSAARGTAGHTLVVTESVGVRAKETIGFCEQKLGLKILRMSNEEHDRAMADVHALTFFVARGLSQLQLKQSALQAPSFQMLLDLVEFDKTHSDDLFCTIELGNPFAKDSRARLITTLERINDKLEREKI